VVCGSKRRACADTDNLWKVIKVERVYLMAYFDWDEKYSVGVKIIDQQHMRLVELLNELYEAMRSGRGKDVLQGVLDGLVDYTLSHFSTEEKLMDANSYPEKWLHKKEHTNLTRQVSELQAEYRTGKSTLTVEVSSFLKDWLVNHIQETDKRFGAFLNGKGIS
jgi:hemerythrin